MLIDRSSKLWRFLDTNLQGLIQDGEALLDDLDVHEFPISDYSYLVFPFAKAYEGFLKKLFLSLNLIDKGEFFGDDVRIGRILTPFFQHEEKNVFKKIPRRKEFPDKDLAGFLWSVWRNGRNLVFHYYPHNFRKLTKNEAKLLIDDIIEVMYQSVELLSI